MKNLGIGIEKTLQQNYNYMDAIKKTIDKTCTIET